MIIEAPRMLPGNVSMTCYACSKEPATHVCRYKVGELAIQVCLCEQCMQMDTEQLLKNTIGLQEVSDPLVDSYLSSKKEVVLAS